MSFLKKIVKGIGSAVKSIGTAAKITLSGNRTEELKKLAASPQATMDFISGAQNLKTGIIAAGAGVATAGLAGPLLGGTGGKLTSAISTKLSAVSASPLVSKLLGGETLKQKLTQGITSKLTSSATNFLASRFTSAGDISKLATPAYAVANSPSQNAVFGVPPSAEALIPSSAGLVAQDEAFDFLKNLGGKKDTVPVWVWVVGGIVLIPLLMFLLLNLSTRKRR